MWRRSTSPGDPSKSNDFKNDHLYSKDGQGKSKSGSSYTARPPSPMVNGAGPPKTPRKNKPPSLGSSHR